MPFVKLDCGILDSTIWLDKDARMVFITALLMAEPFELREAAPQLQVRTLEPTGWTVPPGWYGLIHAAGIGILNRAQVDREAGLVALEYLGAPEESSRSQEFDGRRIVRVNGGYIALNYFKYRDRDYTAAERARRYRERLASRRDVTASHRNITQAEADLQKDQDLHTPPNSTSRPSPPASPGRKRQATAYPPDFIDFWRAYPRKTGKGMAYKQWHKASPPLAAVLEAIAWQSAQPQWTTENGRFIPHPATWLSQRRWEDEPFTTPAETPRAETYTEMQERMSREKRRPGF